MGSKKILRGRSNPTEKFHKTIQYHDGYLGNRLNPGRVSRRLTPRRLKRVNSYHHLFRLIINQYNPATKNPKQNQENQDRANQKPQKKTTKETFWPFHCMKSTIY